MGAGGVESGALALLGRRRRADDAGVHERRAGRGEHGGDPLGGRRADGVAVDIDRLGVAGGERGREPLRQRHGVAGRQDREDEIGARRSPRRWRPTARRPSRARRFRRCGPCSEVRTFSPWATRRPPTAAPIMPGAMTATTGFIVLLLELEARTVDAPLARLSYSACAMPYTSLARRSFGCATAPSRQGITRVPNRLDEIRHDIALASRMLAHENVLDAFGHVSMRHPTDPGRYFLSRSRSPQLLEPGDILEYTLELRAGEAAVGADVRRARDPRLHLRGASRRDGGLPPPCGGGAAVLRRRRADRAGVPPRRRERRDHAVLGSAG